MHTPGDLLWSQVNPSAQSPDLPQLCWQLPFDPHVYGLHDCATPPSTSGIDDVPSAEQVAVT
ncbi:MAG: hypothetical protein ACHREM_07485, partial [Polyangiales bacterium]